MGPAKAANNRPSSRERRFLSRGGRKLLLATGLALTLLLGALALLRPSFLSHLDGRFFDGLISREQPPQGHLLPVVVALDDESLSRFGRWPWPRALVAELLARIAAQRPASVGIDVLFPEREAPVYAAPGFGAAAGPSAGAPRPPSEAAAGRSEAAAGPSTRAARPSSHANAGPSPEAAVSSPGDLALASALAGGPFVLGYEMTFDPRALPAGAGRLRHPLNLVILGGGGKGDPRSGLWSATGAVASRPEFLSRITLSGFLNASVEQDGVMRRMPVLIRQGDQVYPSLALATVLRRGEVQQAVLASTWYGDLVLRIGGRSIPLDRRGRLLLRYRDWHGSSQTVSAAALLEGRLPPDALKGRVVLLGATATGMGEAVTTPVQVSPLLSGVQVHAIAAENMLNGDYARGAPGLFRLLATLLLGALATLACAYLPVLAGSLLLAAAALAAWMGSSWLFQEGGLFLSPVLPVLAALVNFSLLAPIRLFLGERKDRRQARDLAASREFIMSSLASLTEIRDTETGAHILRTQRYLRTLCQELSRYPRYRSQLDPDTIELLAKLAPLHDIGKVGLPDHLLHKTEPFTAQEYEEVKKHAAYGRDAIARAEERSGMRDDRLLGYAKDMAYAHHERWDGTGYPEGLRGEEIPWVGRIMAVADSYDAIISRRVYKDPIPHETAVRIIIQGKGKLFDPDVVEAFTKVADQWWQIACELVDREEG